MSAMPYIGSKISLISNFEIRYEGVLYSINTDESTVSLHNVKMFGTEGRRHPEIAPSDSIYEYIVFRGRDIKDLTVCEPAKAVPDDPAIVTVNVAPRAPEGKASMEYMPHGMGRNFDGGYGPPRQERRGNFHQGNRRGGPSGYPGQNYGPRRPPGSRRLVGELPAQLNQSVKKQLEAAFDFDEANAKLDKTSLKDDAEAKLHTPKAPYSAASFFDSISCETLDRQQGLEKRVDREVQRVVDSQTFGTTASTMRASRFRRSGYRRNPGGGDRSGYGANFNTFAPGVMAGGPSSSRGGFSGHRY
eukprot:Polyplicarium_translucidae@DN1019_c0_g1_i2.p1